MPTFYLDGQPVEYEKGETVLRAALRQGIYIPHYCYHPGLKITTQCRQCLVDVTDMGNGRGIPKLQPSCSLEPAENMQVSASSEKVKWGQSLVNEFLLVNHPLDCPICDQAGECELQNIAHRFGTGHSEMEYEKRVYGYRDVGTFLVLERNRCVQCTRCERYSRDLVGTSDFAVFNRSHEVSFDTFTDDLITHKFQGNLGDICPVGAILNRDWRFRKRAWKLRRTESVCTSCSTGCNITVEHHDNVIYRLKPRENVEVNRWWMCDEGRVNFRPLNDRRTRFVEPMARVRGELVATRWETAYKAVAHRLQEIGASGAQVLALTDTHATNEELFLLRQLLSEGLGSEQVFYPHRASEQQEKPSRPVEDSFLYTLITTDKSPNTTGAAEAGLMGDQDDKRLKAALKAGVKVVFILGTPWLGDENVSNAVRQADLIVQMATHENAWSEVADVVLPGFTYAEKYGTFVNKAGRLQRIQPALRPPEQARDQVRILAGLMDALGKGKLYGSAQEVFADMAQLEGPFKGLTWEGVGRLGTPLPGKARAESA